MKTSSLIKCGVLALLCGCAACSSTAPETTDEMPTGAEIGEQVSKRTEEAETGETTGVIIASSSDGSAAPASPAEDERDEPSSEPETTGPWLRLGDDGSLSNAAGEVSEAPKADEAGRIVVRHAATVTPETLGATIEKLAAAGWTDIRTIVDEAAKPAAPADGGDDEPSNDSAVDAEKNPDDA